MAYETRRWNRYVLTVYNKDGERKSTGRVKSSDGGNIELEDVDCMENKSFTVTVSEAGLTGLNIPAGAIPAIGTVNLGTSPITFAPAGLGLTANITGQTVKQRTGDTYSDTYELGALTFTRGESGTNHALLDISSFSTIQVAPNGALTLTLGTPTFSDDHNFIPALSDFVEEGKGLGFMASISDPSARVLVVMGFQTESGKKLVHDATLPDIDGIVYLYADRNVDIKIFLPQDEGIFYHNYSLKRGWNTVILADTHDSQVWMSAVPDSTYVWAVH